MGNQLAMAQSIIEPQEITPAPNECLPCNDVWKQIHAIQKAQDVLTQLCPDDTRVRGRIVQLDRTIGTEYLNISGLKVSGGGVVYTPIGGGVVPILDKHRWENLTDDLPSTAIAKRVPNAKIWIDLGSDKLIDRIVLTNWKHPTVALQDMVFRRILGATLKVVDESGAEVWKHTFTQAIPVYDLVV